MKDETFRIFISELLMSFQQIILHPKVRSYWGGIIPSRKMMKHSNVHYSRSMIAAALKICTGVAKNCVFQFISKEIYWEHRRKRYSTGASKNKPFWKSNIEAVIFYLCSPKFMYYLCNALYYCKKKVRVILGAFEE